MSILIFDSSSQELELSASGLVVRSNGVALQSLPFGLIERVVIYGNHLLDTDLVGKITRAGASILLLSGRHGRYVATILGERHNDARIRLGQYRAVSDVELATRWASRLILLKLKGQRSVLNRILAERPDLSHPLFQPRARLGEACKSLLAGQASTSESLLGVEGAAARSYFEGFSSAFPESLGFRGRVRRPPADAVNACLSLAYTLLMFEAVSAAHSAGLDPALGFYHQPSFGRASLACDLIEPLRPHADFWVWSLFRNRVLRQESFHNEGAACYLGKAGRRAFYFAFSEFSSIERRRLRRYASLVVRTVRAAQGDKADDVEDFGLQAFQEPDPTAAGREFS